MKAINRSIVKYQLKNNALKAAGMYYAIMILILLTLEIIMFLVSSSGQVSVNNLEFNTTIFLFVYGLNILKSDLKFYSANGLTRKQLFGSVMITGIVLSAAMLVCDVLLGLGYSSVSNYLDFGNSTFGKIYPSANVAMRFAFQYAFYIMMYTTGFFVSNVYYKLNTFGKVVISVSIPGFLLVGLPILDSMYFNHTLIMSILDVIARVMGIWPVNNPIYGVLTFLIIAFAWSASSYLLIRRSILKYQ